MARREGYVKSLGFNTASLPAAGEVVLLFLTWPFGAWFTAFPSGLREDPPNRPVEQPIWQEPPQGGR
jgi:hypothetical protein